MLQTPKKILILSPHPDDGEFGCGGTVARLIEKGAETFYCAFSLCEASLPEGFSEDNIKAELYSAVKKLGIPADHVILHNYPVRRFNEFRQAILEEMVAFQKAFSPDLVFMPTTSDFHQDHQVVSAEGLRAYKHTTILGYELPWNTLSFPTLAISPINEKNLKQKIDAIACYKSQGFRPYFKGDFVKSLASVRGTQISELYAEAFETLRLIV